MPLVSGAVVLVFGGLTLYLRDETFIKLKPTIVYLMFAVLLGAGLLLKKPVLELLLGPVFNLTEQGLAQADVRAGHCSSSPWRWSTSWYGATVSTDIWVTFKAFGFLPLTFLCAVAQMPLMQRYGTAPDPAPRARRNAPGSASLTLFQITNKIPKILSDAGLVGAGLAPIWTGSYGFP